MKKLIWVLFLFIAITACNQSAKKENNSSDPRVELISGITNFEKSLHSDSVLNEQKARDMIGKYLRFTKEYPQDTLTPEYLFRASEIALALNQPLNALKYLSIVVNQHPDYQNYAICLFYLGHTEQNYLNDTAAARRYYEQFLKEFPDHDMANDVRAILQNLGMSDLELVRMFEELNR